MKNHRAFLAAALIVVFVLAGSFASVALAGGITKAAFEANVSATKIRLAEIEAAVAKIAPANLTKRGELDRKIQRVSAEVAEAAKIAPSGYSAHWRELKSNRWSLEKTYYQVRKIDAEKSGKKDQAKAWRAKNSALSKQISAEDKIKARMRGYKGQAGLLDNKAKQRSAGPPAGWDSLLADFKKAQTKVQGPVAVFLDSGLKDWAGKKAGAEAAVAELDQAFDKIRSALR